LGRPEKPIDPDAGPVQRLAWQLRQLREQAGSPSYRRLAVRAHYSASTLAEAAKGDRLPSLELTLGYAQACGADPVEWRLRWSAAAEAATALSPPRDEGEYCPYQGLAAFEPEQADWFFGRTRLVQRLLDRITRLPLIGLFGASGSGKSSLLRAGLLGTIATDDKMSARWRTLLMTPTDHPLDALAETVAKLSGQEIDRVRAELAAGPAALDVLVRNVLAAGPAQTRALLVVDQFEEVFTLCADEHERSQFIDALLDATTGPHSRITVVLGVRADFLAHVTAYPRLLDALADEAQLLVGPVSAADLREIVTRPAARVRLSVEPDLITTVLADAADQPGALPLVSHAMLETWHRRTDATLTLAAYQASGGVRGALAQTAERVHADLDTERQAVARQVFLRLTAVGDGTEDTRRPISRGELDGLADESVIADLLARLAEARLIVLGDGTVNVAHEALIRAWPRLHRWLTDDRASLTLHRRITDAAQTWQSLDRDPGALFRGAQLYGAHAWAQDHPRELNQLEAAFLRASQAQAEAEADRDRRRARLLRRLVAGMSVLLVLALLGGAVAVQQGREARRQQRMAVAEELSLRARSLLATDPDLAGLLAVEAHRLSPSVQTRGAVLSAAAARRHLRLNVGGPPIQSLDFNADHTLLAAAGGDAAIRLWDPVRGGTVATLSGHAGTTMKVAFNADGSRLASTARDASAAGSVIVWDMGTRRQVTRLDESKLTVGMAFSADGTKVAVGVADGAVAVHDLVTRQRRLLPGLGRNVVSLSFSADGQLLAATDSVHHPRVWHIPSGTVLADLPAGYVSTLSFAPSGRLLSGSADDKGLHLWDLSGDRSRALPTVPPRQQYAWTASAPVGDRIAVADENGAISLWDFRRQLRLQVFHDRGRSETRIVAQSPDGAMLASAGFNGTIVVRDLRDQPFAGFEAQIRDIEVSPDETTVATAGDDRAVRLWHPQGRLVATLGGHDDEVQAVAFSPDSRLLATLTRNIHITLWDVQRRRHAAPPFTGGGVGASTDIAFHPGGRFLAAATLGTYVWDVRDPTAPANVSDRYPDQFSTSLAFTPDGGRLISASTAGFVNAWDAGTGKLVTRYNTGQGAVQTLSISPDGRLIATAGDSRTIKLWDAATFDQLAELSGPTAPIQVLAFSRDSRTLASAGDDHTVAVWDVPTRTRIAALTGHQARIRGLAFTPDGALISGGEDRRIIRWSTDLPAATHHICTTAGHKLTRQEWTEHIPTRPYEPTCGPA
jgi:WD40 repeat protein